MKRRWLNSLFCLAGFALLLAAASWLTPKEPQYQGKSVTEWLTCFGSSSGDKEAGAAVRAMGAPALPWIIRELRVKDPPWKQKLIALGKRQTVFQVRFTPDALRRERAIKACQALGSDARPAVPALGEALGYDSGAALPVLASFGAEAIPALSGALVQTKGCGTTYGAATILGDLGGQAEPAITNLIHIYEHHRIAFARRAAAVALGKISRDLLDKAQTDSPAARMAKDALLGGLANEPREATHAVAGLKELGPHAVEATPQLCRWLQHPMPDLRQGVTNALKAISPETLLATASEP